MGKGRAGTPQVKESVVKVRVGRRMQTRSSRADENGSTPPADSNALFSPLLTEESSWDTVETGGCVNETSKSLQVGQVDVLASLREETERSEVVQAGGQCATPTLQAKSTTDQEDFDEIETMRRETPTNLLSSRLRDFEQQREIMRMAGSPIIVASPGTPQAFGLAEDSPKPPPEHPKLDTGYTCPDADPSAQTPKKRPALAQPTRPVKLKKLRFVMDDIQAGDNGAERLLMEEIDDELECISSASRNQIDEKELSSAFMPELHSTALAPNISLDASTTETYSNSDYGKLRRRLFDETVDEDYENNIANASSKRKSRVILRRSSMRSSADKVRNKAVQKSRPLKEKSLPQDHLQPPEIQTRHKMREKLNKKLRLGDRFNSSPLELFMETKECQCFIAGQPVVAYAPSEPRMSLYGDRAVPECPLVLMARKMAARKGPLNHALNSKPLRAGTGKFVNRVEDGDSLFRFADDDDDDDDDDYAEI